MAGMVMGSSLRQACPHVTDGIQESFPHHSRHSIPGGKLTEPGIRDALLLQQAPPAYQLDFFPWISRNLLVWLNST